jgi:hypothetical protein
MNDFLIGDKLKTTREVFLHFMAEDLGCSVLDMMNKSYPTDLDPPLERELESLQMEYYNRGNLSEPQLRAIVSAYNEEVEELSNEIQELKQVISTIGEIQKEMEPGVILCCYEKIEEAVNSSLSKAKEELKEKKKRLQRLQELSPVLSYVQDLEDKIKETKKKIDEEKKVYQLGLFKYKAYCEFLNKGSF